MTARVCSPAGRLPCLISYVCPLPHAFQENTHLLFRGPFPLCSPAGLYTLVLPQAFFHHALPQALTQIFLRSSSPQAFSHVLSRRPSPVSQQAHVSSPMSHPRHVRSPLSSSSFFFPQTFSASFILGPCVGAQVVSCTRADVLFIHYPCIRRSSPTFQHTWSLWAATWCQGRRRGGPDQPVCVTTGALRRRSSGWPPPLDPRRPRPFSCGGPDMMYPSAIVESSTIAHTAMEDLRNLGVIFSSSF